MAWCEANRVDYVFGLARNDRLEKAIIPELITATIESIRTGRTARCFKDFSYTTLDSWSRERRVIGKAEVTGGEANPRFVVTSLKRSEAGARHLYEKTYCARGDMSRGPCIGTVTRPGFTGCRSCRCEPTIRISTQPSARSAAITSRAFMWQAA